MINIDLRHLPSELVFSIENLYIPAKLEIASAYREVESAEYSACRFSINGHSVAFRVAKTTPYKVGQFATIWKRLAPENNILPFDIADNIDFVVINVSDGTNDGQFIFHKEVLLMKNIMSKYNKGGKRAFRLYPPWAKPTSKQALNTQAWQLPYFFSFSKSSTANLKDVRRLFERIYL